MSYGINRERKSANSYDVYPHRLAYVISKISHEV